WRGGPETPARSVRRRDPRGKGDRAALCPAWCHGAARCAFSATVGVRTPCGFRWVAAWHAGCEDLEHSEEAMIRIVKRLPFALLIASTLAAGACYGTVGFATQGADVYVETAPPPPRVDYYDTRPGYVWIGGRWNWYGGQWQWAPGRYERERVGYDYE